ncbi:MAG TPA: two-component regulator propeller domain-containing protein, partial [Pyrinomonadaceae bacterium]
MGRGAINLYEDSKGNLWAGVSDGLWRWKPGPPEFYALPGVPDGIRCLGEDDDGALLIGRQGGIQRFADGKTQAFPLTGAVGQFRAKWLLRDADGGLWIGTYDRGLVHVHQGRADAFAPADGLTGENVYALFEDREGSIWVATINGLDRFRDFTVATFDESQGLPSPNVRSVLAAGDGSVWIVTTGGLNRWHDGRMTSYRERPGRTTAGVSEVVGSGLPDRRVESLFQDSRGRIWVATVSGIGYLEDDRFIPSSGVPGGNTLSIAGDNAGNLWVANEQFGLINLRGGSEAPGQTPWAALGRKDHASTLTADPSQGGLWLGFHLGGVAYIADGQVRASYAAADGLGEGRVNELRFDRDGTLWATTDGGLSRLKNGRVATLTVRSGLPCDTVHWSVEDDARSFWLHTTCGLVRIARPELDAWAAAVDAGRDAPRAIQATVFDSSDGVRPLPFGSHYSPQVTKSADGKLWFAGADGVGVIDPEYLRVNKIPPPVHVEQITADGKTYDATTADGRLRLPPLIRDLQIDYTALSLVAPEKILFRYKLEGRDADWQDVGSRRQAFYNDLPPGDYRFRVMACNNSGVWNEAGTFLDFSIIPAYYQTVWFRVSCAAAFLLLLGTLYQLRLRQVARQVRGRMEERLEEREHIARDLHDTLLQSVQGLILKFHAVAKQIPRGEPAHDALEKTLDRADEVLAEGRDRVRDLRTAAASLDDLPTAFKRIAEEAPNDGEATFKTVVEGGVRELHPVVLEETFSIGREALINALTHSGGRHVEVEMTYNARQFRLRVRDDGRGIDSKILEEGGRPGHWGMQGMRERAEKIGAQLKVWSRPETGTEVELVVPGGTAYRAARDKS